MTRLLLALLLLFLLAANPIATSAEEHGQWVSRECLVTFTGSDWLAIHSGVYACLTNSTGDFSTNPGYITITNRTSHDCTISGEEVYKKIVSAHSSMTWGLPLSDHPAGGKPVLSIKATFDFWQLDSER